MFEAPPGTSAPVAATQLALAHAQLAGLIARDSTQQADRATAGAALAEAEQQARKLSETLPLLDEQIAANEQLLAKGYVSRLRVIEMRRQRLVAARDRDIATETVRKARAQIGSTAGRGAQSLAEARAQVLAALAKAEADAQLREEELVKARQRSRRQILASPVEGTVTQLAVHTVGGVVEAAKPIMVIVPAASLLVAEVRALNKDIGFLREGQEVALKLEAFPFTRHGTVAGRIESIASDAVQDEKLGLVYPVRVALLQRQDRNGLRLAAGLAVTADIRTGRRSLLSYLISPIEEATLEAGRER
jgi:hemolysin D